jgi:hypothetical protein
LEAYAAHNEALRAAEERFQNERDRRYAEVKAAEEKALLVKQQADRDALGLAREIQTYKDEKANELREQINRERLLYASKDDIANLTGKMESAIKPLSQYISTQQGRSSGLNAGWGWIVTAAVVAASSATVIAMLMK